MQARRSTTLVRARGLPGDSLIGSLDSTTPEVAGDVVAALPDRTNGYTLPGVHQPTVSEAKEVWRYEGNRN